MHSKKSQSLNLVELELPNNDEILEKIEKYIKVIQERFKKSKINKTFNKELFNKFDNYIVEILLMLGDHSLPALNAVDELEKKYILLYPNSPALAKKLWLEHVDLINYKYDLLKNRCYKLIEEMQEELIKLKIKL